MEETNKKTPSVIFILTCILLGFLLVLQFRITKFSRSDDLVGQTEDTQKTADFLVTEQTDLKKEIVDLRKEVSELISKNISSADSENLKKLEESLALTPATSAGVIITVADGQNFQAQNLSYEHLLVHAADLRDLVQRLWAGGASAISINGERVVAQTPITCVGNSVLVNDLRILPPFEIIALGDSNILLQELNLSARLPEMYKRIKNGDLSFEVKTQENLTVPAYSGDFATTFFTNLND